MGDELTFTETEVNKMLGDQKTNIRLDGIERIVEESNKMAAERIANEKNDTEKVMKAIEQSGKERRECEVKLKAELRDMDSDHYEKFVKKTDLKVYAFLIVFAVTTTTGFITWLGNKDKPVTASASEIADLVLKKLGK